ncbi:polysaccharide deacetylase family protein [Beijerinckia sp. L45]|uniref:polysaccharide deacetylase family protein n=1 Tax=Beijerinckia sp. L45 TaxID=1641855 RepID=UPI00131B3A95|nr:polysaccharide deacetylase family protein [Beijerinckia sp. L45]
MSASKQQIIAAGFAFFRATRLHRLVAPLTAGQGAILMMHHVRPWSGKAFAPNRLLEIEPGFLDAALTRIKALGFDFVTMDEALSRLGKPGAKRFVTLTFDDGYRDNVEHALPILERHAAPFALFVTTGFADRSARLWWVELEESIRTLDVVSVDIDGMTLVMPSKTPAEKLAAFEAVYWRLRGGPEDRLLKVIADLLSQAEQSSPALVAPLCLDWAGIVALARHPLCTIGVHTLTHPMLAKHPSDIVRRELLESRTIIEAKIGKPARHLAYPVGDPNAAGRREFALAEELGFASAVTTRPGMLFPGHRAHVHALPRLSLNGNWQSLDSLEVLLSGVPFALWNRGRRLNVA